MIPKNYTKWGIQIDKYDKGTFLLGLNFNTNVEIEVREIYLIFYLGKFSICIGRLSYYAEEEG